MSFDKALAYTIQYEGGYANDPNDYGGETFVGISRVYWPDWEGWAVIDSKKGDPNFPDVLYTDPAVIQSVKNFYKTNFWDILKGDQIDAMDEEIAAEAFDAGVNMGTGRAARFLQEALNIFNRNGSSYGEISVDGAIGPGTLGALETFLRKDDAFLMVKAQLIQRGSYYGRRADEDSTQERFIRGWLNRLILQKFDGDDPTIPDPPEPPPEPGESIGNLDDVDITNIQVGQILEWDGYKFVPKDKPC